MGYDPTGRGSELVTERVHKLLLTDKATETALGKGAYGVPPASRPQGLACWDRSGPLPIEGHGRRARSRGWRGCEVWRHGRAS